MRVTQVLVLRVRGFESPPLLGLFFLHDDVVAEWLMRLTRNQFLSGAQVQILPTSLQFDFLILFEFVFIAQLAERSLYTREVQGSIPCESCPNAGEIRLLWLVFLLGS
jgi:hypothetical protein